MDFSNLNQEKLNQENAVSVGSIGSNNLTYPSELWPRSVGEAVELLIVGLSAEDKETIRGITDMFSLIGLCHHGLGTYIRNQFGLYRGNKDLLKACGDETLHPDAASDVILCALWKKLRNR